MKKIILILSILLFIFSCKKDENIVNIIYNSYNFVLPKEIIFDVYETKGKMFNEKFYKEPSGKENILTFANKDKYTFKLYKYNYYYYIADLFKEQKAGFDILNIGYLGKGLTIGNVYRTANSYCIYNLTINLSNNNAIMYCSDIFDDMSSDYIVKYGKVSFK